MTNTDTVRVMKGAAAGIVGGLVASFVMDQFQAGWSAVEKRMQGDGGREKQNEGEPSTVKAAEAVAENVFDTPIPEEDKEAAGSAVHYAMGAGSAAIYGAAAEMAPSVTTGLGMPFRTAVWLVADEGAVPLLGLSKGPAEYPVSKHVYSLASHLVYGLSTEMVRRTVRKALH